MDNRAFGRIGEESAAMYLSDRGYRIIGRNVFVGRNEIDIIAENEFYIVFAEVKTRRQYSDKFDIFGRPGNRVDTRKRASLITAAEEYLRINPSDKSPRIDVIEVYVDPRSDKYNVLDIMHFENAVKKTGKFSASKKENTYEIC